MGQRYIPVTCSGSQRSLTAGGTTTATGSVAFGLDTQPEVSVPISVKGTATWTTPATAGAGTHTVAASYSGDASYNASQPSVFTYTVPMATANLHLSPGGVCGSGVTCTAYAGDSIPVEVYLQGIGCTRPSGTVIVTLGSQTKTATMTPEGSYAALVSTGTAMFSNLVSGTYALSANYSGDSNYQSNSTSGLSIIVVAATGQRVSTVTTISESDATLEFCCGATYFTTSVAGGSGTNGPPTGSVIVYDNGSGETTVSISPSGPNSSSGTSSKMFPDSFNFGLNQITAVYTGDSTYQESVSAPIGLTVVESSASPDFTIAPQVPQVALAAGKSTSTSINLNTIFGFSGTVMLSCTTSENNIGCSVSPTSVELNSSQVAVTISVTTALSVQSEG